MDRSCLYFKLRRLDQPLAKFCLKSDWNSLLIDFCDPIPAARFTHRDDLMQIWTQIQFGMRIRSKIYQI